MLNTTENVNSILNDIKNTCAANQVLDKGLSPTVSSSALKLVSTELSRSLAEVSMDIFGPYGLIVDETEFTPFRGMAPRGYLDCISATIGPGTSEI